MPTPPRHPKPPDDGILADRLPTRRMIIERLRRKESLVGLDLRGLDLSALCFDRADLSGAKLGHADLGRCTFRQAILKNASLWHANLADTNFEGANLEDADLDLANLHGASFKGARIKRTLFPLTRVSLEQVHASVQTGHPLTMNSSDGSDE